MAEVVRIAIQKSGRLKRKKIAADHQELRDQVRQ